MNDSEFRPLCEKWIETYRAAIDASRRYGSLSAELAFTKMPLVTESLDEIMAIQDRIAALKAQCSAVCEESRSLAESATGLDSQIRAILPPNVWYRVNGKGIMHQPGVATQIMDWEDVLEKVNAQTVD